MSKFKCSDCEYESNVKCNIERHIMKKCKDAEVLNNNLNLICDYCEKNITTKQNLAKHLKTCKAKKANIEQELLLKSREIEKLKLENEQYKKINDEINKKVNEKVNESLESFIKLVDKKILGNTNVETIRSQARKKYKEKFPDMKCIHCSHIGSTQVCHIKAISDFDKCSLIDEINDLSNLIGLCPNCHIDLDKHKKFEVTRTALLHSLLVTK